MKWVKGYIFLWIAFFFMLVLYGFFGNNFSISGDIPLTGILKETPGEQYVFPDFNISFSFVDKDIYKLRDIEFSLHFVPIGNTKSLVTLDYVVVDKNGEIKFFDQDVVNIQNETTIDINFDRRKAQEIKLAEGEYTLSVRVSYDNSDKTFSHKFFLQEISDLLYSIKQLFDIKMEIDGTTIKNAKDLSARVIFTSFGSEPTPVNLSFFIYDKWDNEVYRDNEQTTVETEKIVIHDFNNFNAPSGEYLVVLRTVYNVDVEDYFEQKIIIQDRVSPWPFIILGIILIAGVVVFFINRRK